MSQVCFELRAKKKSFACAFVHSIMVSHKIVPEGGSDACDQKTRPPASTLSLPVQTTHSLSSVRAGSTVNILPTKVPRMQLRTCRQCKKRFDPSENHGTACHYHPETFTGDSRRKAEWGDNNDAENYVSGDGTAEHFWW